jgi:hypothetical protein
MNTPANVITSQDKIAEAPTSALVATYNWLTGKTISRFSSRGAGEAQVANAILAAADRAAHKGVPKGKKGEVAAGALGNGKTNGAAPVSVAPAPAVDEPTTPAPAPGAFAQIDKALNGKHIPVKQPKKGRAPRRQGVTTVRVTGSGWSRPQEGSTRSAVLKWVAGRPNKTATIEEIEKHFKHPCRGYVQKLIEVEHFAVVE